MEDPGTYSPPIQVSGHFLLAHVVPVGIYFIHHCAFIMPVIKK